MPDLKTALGLRAMGGAMKADGLLESLADGDAAYAEFDAVSGYARFGAKGTAGASRGVKVRSLNAGAAVDAAVFLPNGDVTLLNVAALMATLTSTTRPLRLCYDGTHYVDFAVSSSGALVVTTAAGQSVTVAAFNATGKTALSAQTRIGDVLRIDGIATPDLSGLAGRGIEAYYDTTNDYALLQAYDRTAATYTNLIISAKMVDFTGVGTTGLVSVPAVNTLRTAAGLTTGTHGTPTTLFTLPAINGVYRIVAALTSNTAANAAVIDVVVTTAGASTQIVGTATGGDLTLSLSGLDVQATLGVSDNRPISATALRVL